MRPRLIERLNAGQDHKMTLISAPVGFGKTTLVSEWVEDLRQNTNNNHQNNKIAWLSLEENDNEIIRFLTYSIAALQTIETNVAKGLLNSLQSPQPPPTEVILTALINEITKIPDKIVFVLDDYHNIESSPIDEALTFWLNHMPPQMRLVIVSRDDPQLPIARLRARNQLTELRAVDLRFTLSEAAEFLHQSISSDLSSEDIAALEARTEGWIAGLQLAAISMQGHNDIANLIKSFTGSHRFVLDYLIEEVLEQQSESVQTFLLQTSILDRMNGSLCDALTGQDDSQEMLETLERTNLFLVSLDQVRYWYRYHRLFADLLRRRLSQTQSSQISLLYRRASEWNEQNGFSGEAIEYALRAEDFERAAGMIEENFDSMYRLGEHIQLRQWLTELPDEFIISKPQICLLQAWNLFTSGQQQAAEESLQVVENLLNHGSDRELGSSTEQGFLNSTERIRLQGRAEAMHTFLASYRGDVPGTIQYAQQALNHLPEQDLIWRSTAAIALGDAYSIKGDMAAAYQTRLETLKNSKASGDNYLFLLANLKLATTLRAQGQLKQVIEICQRRYKLVKESGQSKTVAAGWLLAIWGEALAEMNSLDEAIRKAKKGAELAEHGRDVVIIGWSYLYLIRVLFSRGDLDEAEKIIQKMQNITRDYHLPPWITNPVTAWQARVWLAQDKPDAASQWLAEREMDVKVELLQLREAEYLTAARILISQGSPVGDSVPLHRLLEAAEAGENTSRVIEILILQALDAQTRGNTEQALATLERALVLAEPDGYVRIFVDEGQLMACLLYEALSHQIVPGYIQQLLAAFPTVEPKQEASYKDLDPGSQLIEPLSEREIEVLQLIAGGFTNQEIANKLYLSLNTVKVHTRNIYGKLCVNNRTSAVTKAQALGIISIT